MTASATQALITGGITDYGTAMLAVLGVVIGVIVGFYVFRAGVRWLKRAR